MLNLIPYYAKITDKKINLISTVSMFNTVRKWNKKK